MEREAEIHRKRAMIATIFTVVILLALGAFVVRVMHYLNLIQSGELDPSTLSFLSSYSVSTTLASQPIEDGIFDLTSTDDPSLGPSSAVVTIVEFADFECPYSKDASFTVRELATQYPQEVRFIYRDFPLSDVHLLAQKAAQAGECAQDQGKFWEYHDKIYQNQSGLTQERLVEFADELNMNTFQFESCLNSDRYADEILEDFQAGVEAGVRGTPTFFINGNRIAGAIPKDVFDSIIQSILNRE